MNIQNLTMSFGLQTIYDNVSFQINENDKVGIVGVNGAGKSTLFNLILGKLTPDEGKIIIKNNINIGYLPQVITDEIPNDDITVFEYLLLGRPIEELKNKLTNLYEKIATIEDQKELNHYLKEITKVEDKLTYYDEYNAESTLLKIITGMNIDDKLLDLKLKNISGGQKSKIAFARLLYSKPEIMLLDEPEVIRKKIMGATTDSEMSIKYDPENKPGVSNLITLYHVFTDMSIEDIEKHFEGANYGTLKKEVADVIIENVTKIQKRYYEIINSDEIDKILDEGREKTLKIAEAKYNELKYVMGLHR